MRAADAIRAGINPATLYSLRDAGVLECAARGLYRLAEQELPDKTDLVTVAAKVPDAVVCLLSALDWHGLTTQVPHMVYIAIRQGSRTPKLAYPPLRVFRFTEPCFSTGVETHEVSRMPVRVYSPEKTVVDCFKHRSKVGLDVALEALRLYAESDNPAPSGLLSYATACRVATVIRPYLEAVFG